MNREWWRESDPAPAHPELEFWRVEASSAQGRAQGQAQSRAQGQGRGQSQSQGQGRGRPTGTYELRRDVATGSWTLRRVAD